MILILLAQKLDCCGPPPCSPAKVTQLEDGSFRVHQQVLGLDVSVTHALGMDVGQTAKQLVHVHLRRGGTQTFKRRQKPAPEDKAGLRVLVLTFTYMIGMMLLALLKCLATLYTVSGTKSRTRLRYTSSFCTAHRDNHELHIMQDLKMKTAAVMET